MAWIPERCTECGGTLAVDGPRAKCSSCGMTFFDPDRVPPPGPEPVSWLDRGVEYPIMTSCAQVRPRFTSFGEFGEAHDIRIQI